MKLSKKELKFIKKYPNLYSMFQTVNVTDYRIINGTPLYKTYNQSTTDFKSILGMPRDNYELKKEFEGFDNDISVLFQNKENLLDEKNAGDNVSITRDKETNLVKIAATISGVKYKGFKLMLTEVLDLKDMVTGDMWFVQFDNRLGSAVEINSLIVYNGTDWVFGGKPDTKLDDYYTKKEVDDKIEPEYIVLNDTEGTLTTEQYNTLTKSVRNYISWSNNVVLRRQYIELNEDKELIYGANEGKSAWFCKINTDTKAYKLDYYSLTTSTILSETLQNYYTAQECNDKFFDEQTGVELDERVHKIEQTEIPALDDRITDNTISIMDEEQARQEAVTGVSNRLVTEVSRATARENEIEGKIPTEKHLYEHTINLDYDQFTKDSASYTDVRYGNAFLVIYTTRSTMFSASDLFDYIEDHLGSSVDMAISGYAYYDSTAGSAGYPLVSLSLLKSSTGDKTFVNKYIGNNFMLCSGGCLARQTTIFDTIRQIF